MVCTRCKAAGHNKRTCTSTSATLPRPGAGCSVSGHNYEKKIAAVCRQIRSPHSAIPLNTQREESLGGSTAGIDIVLNWKSEGDIGVEAKRPTPDWMQMCLERKDDRWIGKAEHSKIPSACREQLNELLMHTTLFQGKLPPFMEKTMTHAEWVAIKTADPDLKDHYIHNIPNTTIAELYRKKGCSYLQVDGKGLYHTGEDTCDFQVPLFECPQQLRIRIKIHKTNPFHASVTVAAQPVNLAALAPSPFSLDSLERLPASLGE